MKVVSRKSDRDKKRCLKFMVYEVNKRQYGKGIKKAAEQ